METGANPGRVRAPDLNLNQDARKDVLHVEIHNAG
jgi:hypothetical protein